MTTLIAVFYALWIVVTLFLCLNAKQFTRFKPLDIFHLLPSYRFFSPNPIKCDYHIFYRDKNDNAIGEINHFSYISHTPLKLLFNHSSRLGMSIFKIVNTLDKQVSRGEPREILITGLPYIHLMYLLIKKINLPVGAQRQFIIMKVVPGDTEQKPIIVLASEFHGD